MTLFELVSEKFDSLVGFIVGTGSIIYLLFLLAVFFALQYFAIKLYIFIFSKARIMFDKMNNFIHIREDTFFGNYGKEVRNK